MTRTTPSSRRRLLRLAALAAVALSVYPAFVLIYVYAHFFARDLPGGRHGPADAYRHSLASAVVAYTLSPRCVELVTRVMENDGQGSAARAMDAQNNRIGARIGASAGSWSQLQQDIDAAVDAGTVDSRSPERITWLAPRAWQERLY